MKKPILYSFRRCPYAMRARLGLKYANISVELREIILKAKPVEMLLVSPKGTVPVLLLADGKVVDESLDILCWAVKQHDPQQWLGKDNACSALKLIEENDTQFKHWLDKYKYADRHPEQPAEFYRQQCELFIQTLETRLSSHAYLLGENISLADIAILPFIRQFSMVNQTWFDQSGYTKLQHWLQRWLHSALFISVMEKYAPWSAEANNSQAF